MNTKTSPVDCCDGIRWVRVEMGDVSHYHLKDWVLVLSF